MEAEQKAPANAAEYISHHLANLSSGGHHGGFWTFHLDTFWVSLVLGFVFVGLFGLVARRASVDKPGRFQLFVEMIVEMVAGSVKEIFHGKSTLVAPLALTVFVWIVLMNAMDFLPVDLAAKVMGAFGIEHFKVVPTADINMTLAMSLSVVMISILLGIQTKGIVGFIKEFFTAPFHAENPLMVVLLLPINALMQLIEYGSRILSMALRLAGNMFAGELLFMLIALMGAAWTGSNSSSLALAAGHLLAGSVWAIFHILIVVLQAYIFMMLTIVYCAMGVEEH
ncbi:F0F1 ATP synthase subunit A [Chitinimonas sp.]|uniref:F0F1 ATP synthase subunit A n=1 Tax=Chitinimonas sp. TaxID=1934313 RepID=UPI0035B2F3C2